MNEGRRTNEISLSKFPASLPNSYCRISAKLRYFRLFSCLLLRVRGRRMCTAFSHWDLKSLAKVGLVFGKFTLWQLHLGSSLRVHRKTGWENDRDFVNRQKPGSQQAQKSHEGPRWGREDKHQGSQHPRTQPKLWGPETEISWEVREPASNSAPSTD